MINSIKFSVVIPLYNKGGYINRALISILVGNNDVSGVEVVVVDDGSTDDGLSIVNELSKNYSNLRVYAKDNGGASSARNYGINKARGEYIIFLDADDELRPGAIQAYSSMINKFIGAGVFGVNFSIIKGGVETERRQPGIIKNFLYQRVDYFELISKGAWLLTSSSTCVKKSLFKVVGLFDENLTQREDPHMWHRLAMVSPVVFCNKALSIYYQDDNFRICSTRKAVDEFADCVLIKSFIDDGVMSRNQIKAGQKIISYGYLIQAVQNLQVGNVERAKSVLRRASFMNSPNKALHLLVALLIISGAHVFISKMLNIRKLLLSQLYGI